MQGHQINKSYRNEIFVDLIYHKEFLGISGISLLDLFPYGLFLLTCQNFQIVHVLNCVLHCPISIFIWTKIFATLLKYDIYSIAVLISKFFN